MAKEQKAKKVRKLTKETKQTLLNRFVKEYKATTSEISAKTVSKDYNISISLVKDLYIEAAGNGLIKAKLDSEASARKDPKDITLGPTGRIVIGKREINRLNKILGANKFNEGDKFEPSIDDGKIVLTKKQI